MGYQFLIADVLSLERNDVMRSPTMQGTIQALYLFVPLLHLIEVNQNKSSNYFHHFSTECIRHVSDCALFLTCVFKCFICS